MPENIFDSAPMFDDADAAHITEDQKYAAERFPAAVRHSGDAPPPAGRRITEGTQAVTGPTAEQAVIPTSKLAFAFGDKGEVYVAKHVAGNQAEQWRQPTSEELAWLKAQSREGRIQTGAFNFRGKGPTGLGAAETAGMPTWLKVSLGLAGTAVVVGGGVYAYRKVKNGDWQVPFLSSKDEPEDDADDGEE